MKHKVCGCMALTAVCLIPLLSACAATPGITPPPTVRHSPTPSPTLRATTVPTIIRSSPPPPPTDPSPTSSPLSPAAAEPSATPIAVRTRTPEPSPTPAPPDEVMVRQDTISIPQYPYEQYLHEAFDAQRGVPYLWLDREAYGQPSSDALTLKYFEAVILENRYLRLTVLPELGGRIYECIFKPTDQNLFYSNQALKPTPWGPLIPPFSPHNRNWWLAAGGMEWAFPVHEHGYEWGLPWSYSIERSAAQTTVTLSDSSETRPRMSVQIALAPGKAYFTTRPQIENPTSSQITYQYWTNAMLTLGSPSMSANTEFIYPAEEIIIHSAGPDSGLPGERSRIGWPLYQGQDLSWYYNWVDWLGFFIPRPAQDFVGAYNHDTELGVARIFPRQEVPGVKLFAWGQETLYASEYTDDSSQYFEIWGGPNRTFWPEDDNRLGPGQSKGWSECWYPFSHIGGLDFANCEAALSLHPTQGFLRVGVATTSYQEVSVVLILGEDELHREEVAVSPDNPYLSDVPLPPEAPATVRVSLRVLAPDGEIIARHDEDMVSP